MQNHGYHFDINCIGLRCLVENQHLYVQRIKIVEIGKICNFCLIPYGASL